MALNQPSLNLAENEQRVLHAGRIPYQSFKNTIITMFSIACFTLTARIITRLSTRRRLHLDDFFIILGFIILSGTTYLVMHSVRSAFVSEAVATDLFRYVTTTELLGLLNSVSAIQAFLCMAWSAIFCVKLSFLALFRVLIRRLSRKLTIYYWVVVVVTILTWMFLAFDIFILCPQALSCAPSPRLKLGLELAITCPILDIATDVMIVSIPMIVLNKTQMGLSRKIGLGVFLCLSVAMALIALVRIGGYRIEGQTDVTWQVFWQYIEACIAIIMGSATAFRTLFVGENSRKSPERKPSYSIRQRLLRKNKPTGEKSDWEDANGRHLPTVPSATLSGLRTFIHRQGRTRVGMTSRGLNWETLPAEKDDTHLPLSSRSG